MIVRSRERSGGFSLVELLVVMAIVVILLGISIPILQMFSQNEMDRGARSLYTMIRAARVYAATYNVRTAVVYQLDDNPVNGPIMDTLRNQAVRVLRGATVLYELPAGLGPYKGLYVPTPGFDGEFQPFPLDYAVLLDVPPDDYRQPPKGLVFPHGAPWEPTAGDPSAQPPIPSNIDQIGLLGLSRVLMYDAEIMADPDVRNTQFDPTARVPLLAHVFDTGGRLVVGGNATTQRFSILYAPLPSRPIGERAWTSDDFDPVKVDLWLNKDPSAPEMGLLGIPIEIYRSTGRVRMGSL